MKILVTAGNTQAPIDDVRCITNIFTGRTGALIALEAHRRGHEVTLATSNPSAVHPPSDDTRWRMATYRTYAELAAIMESELIGGGYNAVVHSAAVSDYLHSGAFAPAKGASFNQSSGAFAGEAPHLVPVDRGKISSGHSELWLRLTPAPKLIDRIRGDWRFTGFLVKFKLEVGLTEERLGVVGENARAGSDADLLVANTLEGMNDWALLIANTGDIVRVARGELAPSVLDRIIGHEAGK